MKTDIQLRGFFSHGAVPTIYQSIASACQSIASAWFYK